MICPLSRHVLGKLNPNAVYSILDEIVFKISASKETAIAR